MRTQVALAPLVALEELRTWFPVARRCFHRPRLQLRAVDGVSFSIRRGEILGLVGESGSGKTTLGRSLLRAVEPTGGKILFDGTDITHLGPRALRPFRRRMQLVFQDPTSSLNPRLRIGDAVGEPLLIHGLARDAAARRERVAALLAMVGLPAETIERYPHEFSGGQRQRIGIARALAPGPEFLLADEPVSALDVSIQAQVVNLLLDIRGRLGLAMLVIAHDIAVVEHLADRIAVMYLGRIVELAESRVLCRRPRHPYTAALLSAVPRPDPGARSARLALRGEPPSPVDPPSGCAFRTRCCHALAACAQARPELHEVAPGHWSACIREDIFAN
ncbi:MAG TPA: ABC transporter ATP-binding protein [Acetobacteraceae bacterium]|nr:ABC transporter ATP-binding protein [Acetobacteraceae bacterium]